MYVKTIFINSSAFYLKMYDSKSATVVKKKKKLFL